MFLGVRTSIWIVFSGLIVFTLLGAVLFLYRKRLKEWWLKWRSPNHVYRLIIFYPGNRFRIFWDKVNDKDQFRIDDNIYDLEEQAIQKEHKGYGTLMYFEKSPTPIQPDIKNHDVKMTSRDLALFKDEDLISKLLMVDIGEKLIRILMIIGVVQLIATAYLIYAVTAVPK